MLISLLGGIPGLILMISIMVCGKKFWRLTVDHELASVPFHTEIEKRLRI